MKVNKPLIRRTVLSVFSIFLIFALFFGAWTAYQSKRHSCVSSVESITASYPYSDNAEICRVEIKGTLKNWFYDNTVHENVTLLGDYGGGEPMYSRYAVQSNTLTVSKEEAEFLIVLDVDTATKNWGDLEAFVRGWRFRLSDASEVQSERQAVFVADFENVPLLFEIDTPTAASSLLK